MSTISKKGIIITIPKTVKWDDYKKELDAVADWKQVMNFKVSHKPKNLEVGNRVYLCYDNNIIGWQTFVGYYEGNFDCTTTGKEWNGTFIQRSGPFHYLQNPIPCNGFRGFKYFNYQINETINPKQLIEEEHSRNTEVQKLTKTFVENIKNKINSFGKQNIVVPLCLFGNDINVNIIVYNSKTYNDCAAIIGSNNKENYFNTKTKTMYLTLFFVNKEPVNETYDAVVHEFSHVYQSDLVNDEYSTDIYKVSLMYRNSKNKFENRLSCLVYLSDSHEQDSIVQGLESCIENTRLSAQEALEASEGKDYLLIFEKLIKDFENNKENYIFALQPYRQYNIDYTRFLKHIKTQYKRFKLKIGHIFDLHEQGNKINFKNIL